MAASFSEVLTQAVSDLATHGYDSADRVSYWQERLREAAEASMTSQAEMEAMLREALGAVYKRLVDDGGLVRMHPGVARFTVERLRPRLRAELDRRVMASADLIRLNRRAMIAKTQQRFSGWATSVPKGGSEKTNRREEKARVRKALGSLPFEERRVLIDQGHKLTAAISEVVATDGGAIAAEWHSRWRQAGYDYRPDHRERDLQVYLLRSSWAREGGLVKPGPAGLYEDVTSAGQEPFCRCYIKWLYNVGQLPDDMVTAKGRRELDRVRREIAA